MMVRCVAEVPRDFAQLRSPRSGELPTEFARTPRPSQQVIPEPRAGTFGMCASVFKIDALYVRRAMRSPGVLMTRSVYTVVDRHRLRRSK